MTHAQEARITIVLALAVAACGDDAVGSDTDTADESSSTMNTSPSTSMTTSMPGTSESTDGPETTDTDPSSGGMPVCGDGIEDPGEDCDHHGESAMCNADCTPAACGDGVLNVLAGEQCDDAGRSTACNDDCTLAECGDGITNATAGEVCDDDGESATCNDDCTAAACGDGTLNVTAGEACDDGGESATCNVDCSVAACGDGITNASADEECDDAGRSGACNADCTNASCGDGVFNATAGEDCDDGGESATCNVDCSEAACGDGITNATAGEACDDAGESASCDSDCTPAACGDGITNVTAGEACDSGGESATCDTDCTPSECGDGDVNATAGETCDDGDAGGCSSSCTAIGKVIWMGHDFYSRNAAVDQIIGNAVLMADTLGTIDVLGYNEFADLSLGGEYENTNAAIMDEAMTAGEIVTITAVSDDALVAGMLPSYDVFLVYEMELGGDGAAIGAGLAGALQSFLDGGGVVIVMDHFSQGAQLLDAAGAMGFLGLYTTYGDVTVTVTAPLHPLMAGVPTPTYTGTNGTASYWTNDGTVLGLDPAGLPVLVYKEWDQPRFDGSVGAWEIRANCPDNTASIMTYHPTHIPNIYNMLDFAGPATGYSYDPATNLWSPLVQPLPYNDYWFQTAPVGRRLFGFPNVGGVVRWFDIATNAWASGAAFSGTAEYTMTAADERGYVYAYLSNGNVVRYDPSLNSVTYHATGLGSLFESRVVYDPTSGLLYLGQYGAPELYSFDIDTGITTPLSSIPESQLNDIFCGDRSGHIYAAGDFGGSTMWQYDIATDTWLAIPDYPVEHGNSGSCVVSDTGYLYVGNGLFDWYRLPLF